MKKGRAKKILKAIDRVQTTLKRMDATITELARIVEKLGKPARTLALAGIALAAAGCASMDGRTHTAIAGYSIHKAYRLAEASGWERIDTEGERHWVQTAALEAAGLTQLAEAAPGVDVLNAELRRTALAKTVGLTDRQIQQQFNSSGIMLAKIGDGLWMSLLTGGLVWAADQINGNDGNDKAATTTAASVPAQPTQQARDNGQVAGGTGNTIIQAAAGATITIAPVTTITTTPQPASTTDAAAK